MLETLLELGVGETGIRNDFSITPDEKQYHNLIIIGSADFQPIAEINSNWQKIGLFHRFSADALEIYSSSGNLDASIAEGAGISPRCKTLLTLTERGHARIPAGS